MMRYLAFYTTQTWCLNEYAKNAIFQSLLDTIKRGSRISNLKVNTQIKPQEVQVKKIKIKIII